MWVGPVIMIALTNCFFRSANMVMNCSPVRWMFRKMNGPLSQSSYVYLLKHLPSRYKLANHDKR